MLKLDLLPLILVSTPTLVSTGIIGHRDFITYSGLPINFDNAKSECEDLRKDMIVEALVDACDIDATRGELHFNLDKG